MDVAKKAPFLRSTYNYDMDKASDDAGLCCRDPSLTKQSFAEEADINTMISRFGVGYEMPAGVVAPTYMDFEGVYDFRTAMTAITDAREAFQALPADVRYRFANDPQRFLEFCSNDSNRAEAVKLGLVVPVPEAKAPEPVAVRVVAPEGVPEKGAKP